MMPFSQNLSAIENILSTQSLLNFNASAQSDFFTICGKNSAHIFMVEVQ